MAILGLKRRLAKVQETRRNSDPWQSCAFRWTVYRNLHLTYKVVEGPLLSLDEFCNGGEDEIEFKKSILEVTSND